MPAGSRYTLWYGSLALSVDPLRHLHLDLRRLARPALHTPVRQNHHCPRVSGRILPISVPGGAVVQDRGERFDVLPPTDHESLQRYLNQIPEDFEMCCKVWEEI